MDFAIATLRGKAWDVKKPLHPPLLLLLPMCRPSVRPTSIVTGSAPATHLTRASTARSQKIPIRDVKSAPIGSARARVTENAGAAHLLAPCQPQSSEAASSRSNHYPSNTVHSLSVVSFNDAGPCVCEPRWKGSDCSVTLCPNSCSGNGFCTDSGCQCYPGYLGVACEKTTCRHDCSGHGRCLAGTCQCETGWANADCAIPLNPRRAHMTRMSLPGENVDETEDISFSSRTKLLRAHHARVIDIEESGG